MSAKETYIDGLYQIKYEEKNRLVTKNLVPGQAVYGEKLIDVDSVEYRIWNPYRSKYAAAFLSEMKSLPQIMNQDILYLGVSTGTTASHFSDMIKKGRIYGVEFSHRVMREFVKLSQQRENLIPILGDARNTSEFSHLVLEADVIYQDVAQPDLTSVFGRNCAEFLKQGGRGLLCVKSQSIDVSIEPEEIFEREAKILEEEFGLQILEMKSIHSFEKKHAIIIVKL